MVGFAVGPIFSGVLGVITLPVMAWTFSAEDIGRLSMLQLLTTLGVIVFCLGMDQAYARDFHEVGEESRPGLLVAAALPALAVFWLVAGGVMLFAPELPAKLAFGIPSVVWSAGLLVSALLALISRLLSVSLRMREQGLAFSLSQSLPKLLFLLVMVGAWILHVASFDLLLLAYVSTLALVLFAYCYYTRSEWISGISSPIDWSAMRRMFRFGAPLVLGGLASWAVMTLDKVLLRNSSTLEELGIYSVAASLASSVGVATVLFTTIWVPTVYKWHAQGDEWPRVQAASRHATAACSLALTIAGALSPAVALLLPNRYALVPLLIPACMTLPLFYALSEATAVGLGLGRKSIYSMVASLSAACSGFAAGALLVPGLGARGAAVAAVVAATVFVLVRTEVASRTWRPIPRAEIYSVVLTLSLLASAYAVSDLTFTGYWTMAWCGVLLGATWLFRGSVQLGVTSLQRFLHEWRRPENAH